MTRADDIHAVRADVFAPCALGGAIGEDRIPNCAVVAGAANNQLATAGAGKALAARGILYTPDFLINAGGMIAAGQEIHAPGPVAPEVVDVVFDTARQVFEAAVAAGVTPEVMALRLATERLAGRAQAE